MFKVVSCLSGQHDYRYVALAAVVCIFGSFLSSRFFLRVRRTEGSRKFHWLFLTAILSGGTIWTTHFVAMLGYTLPLDHSYDFKLTLISLVIAVVGTGSGFLVASLSSSGPEIEAGGAIVGASIAAMHYTGMAAFQVSGLFEWDRALVAASVVFGVAFGMLAANRLARPVTRFCKYGGTTALVLAICLMHFTGMGAMTIIPVADMPVPTQTLSNTMLIVLVVGAMALLLATATSAYLIDQDSSAEAVRRYRHLALHDPLTGLPNRSHLSARLPEVLHAHRQASARVAVVTFDLDRFKDINDVHGHSAGDVVLKAISERISRKLRRSDFLARLGGDEFVAVRDDIYAPSGAGSFAEEILSICQEPIDWNGIRLTVGASVGVAIFPDDGTTAEALLGRADLAMYRAKALGRNRHCLFDLSMDETNRSRSALAMDLKQALARGEFELYYQPQNDTGSRAVVGFEALLRWNHPVRGMVSPSDFVPIAEETGLIVEIGEWVMREACRRAAGWNAPYRVAVNVAAAQLAQPNLPAIVHSILLETGLPAARLEIEITESGIISDQQHALHIIRQLKALGVRIAMDDYGTGYSSLSTLQNFPFDKIKIDRTFVDSVLSSPQAAAIVRATIILGASLNIPVLAEGVETEEHIAFLHSEGCSELQGYFFGKPMPGSAIDGYLTRETATTARARDTGLLDLPAPQAAAARPALPAATRAA